MSQKEEAKYQLPLSMVEEELQCLGQNSTSMLQYAIVVLDPIADSVVGKILESTSSGLAGEGKIFISEIDDAVDIGSGERGDCSYLICIRFKEIL